MNITRRDGIESKIIGGFFSLWIGYLVVGIDPTAIIISPIVLIYLACLLYYLMIVSISLRISLMYTDKDRFLWYFVVISGSVIAALGFWLLSIYMKQADMATPASWAIGLGIPILLIWIVSLELCNYFQKITVNSSMKKKVTIDKIV